MGNEDVRELVRQLLEDAKMTPQEISEALEGRVSARTIYRWENGESLPGNSSDLEALRQLVLTRTRKDAKETSA